eukprot:jgi/Tetstr1/433458/TSEL_022732.t1
MFASSEPEALKLRQRVTDLLDSLGMVQNPAKGLWANGRPIHRHVETAYMHCDSSGYGWVEYFLPHLASRRVLLHEDNKAVCSVLAGLTCRSPEMMAELRKLWYLLDINAVHITARYIRPAANVWADRLSRHLDSDDWQLVPVLFAELEAMWDAHSVDRFASAINKLRQSGAAATVVAPRWEAKGVPPLGATPATVARYIAWQGLLRTVKAASLQPYLSAINDFYRNHGAEPVAQGDLINKVRKGLAASQVEPDPPGVRTDVPARLITRTLRLAETMHWLQLVAHMLEEHPPPGFVWTSHSLRKCAATAVYAIGVVLQKIKHFGGWAQLSSVVLDYIHSSHGAAVCGIVAALGLAYPFG